MEWNRTAVWRGLAVAAALALAFVMMPLRAGAQTSPDTTKPCDAKPAPPETVQTFFLTSTSDQNDLNDIQTDLRNNLPRARIYGLPPQDAITVRATAEDMETAQTLIAALDRPKKLYRLTFTITDIDSGKRTGSQEFVVLALPGRSSNLKQGMRVPIVTGKEEGPGATAQMQYVDVGLSIEAFVTGTPGGLTLHAKVEQSSLAEEKPSATQDPVMRQTVLDDSSELTPGKPLVLGSLAFPGTARRQEIAVTAELVR